MADKGRRSASYEGHPSDRIRRAGRCHARSTAASALWHGLSVTGQRTGKGLYAFEPGAPSPGDGTPPADQAQRSDPAEERP